MGNSKLKQKRSKKIKEFDELTITDDFMFGAVMSDPKRCKPLLEYILGIKIIKIEYTEKGGEKKHLTFEDTVCGPQFEPLMELIAENGLSPVFICESAGTQAEDAHTMREYYNKVKEGLQ